MVLNNSMSTGMKKYMSMELNNSMSFRKRPIIRQSYMICQSHTATVMGSRKTCKALHKSCKISYSLMV